MTTPRADAPNDQNLHKTPTKHGHKARASLAVARRHPVPSLPTALSSWSSQPATRQSRCSVSEHTPVIRVSSLAVSQLESLQRYSGGASGAMARENDLPFANTVTQDVHCVPAPLGSCSGHGDSLSRVQRGRLFWRRPRLARRAGPEWAVQGGRPWGACH